MRSKRTMRIYASFFFLKRNAIKLLFCYFFSISVFNFFRDNFIRVLVFGKLPDQRIPGNMQYSRNHIRRFIRILDQPGRCDQCAISLVKRQGNKIFIFVLRVYQAAFRKYFLH